MELLPPEILINIFLNLSIDDIPAVCDTCTYWKSVIEYYNIWKIHWNQLLKTTSKTILRNSSYLILKELNINDLDLKQSCIRLKNVLYDENNELNSCLIEYTGYPYEYAVLRTHFSKIILKLSTNNTNIRRLHPINYIRRNNIACPTCSSYLDFRLPPKMIENIDAVFSIHGGHRHIHQLVYLYPLGLSAHMDTVISRMFEHYHISEVLLVPRTIALCENLSVTDAIVVYSTSRSTEVAIVCDGQIIEGRWIELLIGGWQVAQNLHATFTWLYPDVPHDPCRFDDPSIKSLCWLRTPRATQHHTQVTVLLDHNRCFELKEEQYLAPELMYDELDLLGIVEKLTFGMENEQLERCLSHILLAGGNCKLQHLHIRIRLDFMERWPQFADSINTSVHSRSEFEYTPPNTLLDPPPTPQSHFVCGQPCRITRDSYIARYKQE